MRQPRLNEQVCFRCTVDEKRRITAIATARNQTVAQYLRSQVTRSLDENEARRNLLASAYPMEYR